VTESISKLSVADTSIVVSPESIWPVTGDIILVDGGDVSGIVSKRYPSPVHDNAIIPSRKIAEIYLFLFIRIY
jgi:hypothetical protein